jgi:hypothetical protein
MFTLLALMFFLLVLMVRVGSLRPDFLFDRMMCWLTWILAFKGLLQKTRSIDLLFVSNGSLARPAVFYSWLARRLCLFKTLLALLGCFSLVVTRSHSLLVLYSGSLVVDANWLALTKISADLAD